MPLLRDESNNAGIKLRSDRYRNGNNFRATKKSSNEVEKSLSSSTRLNVGQRSEAMRAGLLSTCANPDCRSGWLHFWRKRSAPIFEGGWSCSASCTLASIDAAIFREMAGKSAVSATHRHRVPLGLVMLEQGWITAQQLRLALDAQRVSGQGLLGKWLVREHGVPEQKVTRALSLQWSCPVLQLEHHDPEAMSSVLPRLFVEAFGVLPLRIAAGRILYLGFESRPDPVVTLAAERMLGIQVEAGLVRSSLFKPTHDRLMKAKFPATGLIEVSANSQITRILTKAVERTRPVESRLVRVHDCLWLRMWKRLPVSQPSQSADVEDMICSLPSN